MLGAGISLTRLGRLTAAAVPQSNGVPASAFSPADLSPLAWWNIADTSTVFQNSAATVPLSGTATPVGAILDQSGNGHHLLQPSENARPLWHHSSGACWLENDQVDDDGCHLMDEVTVRCVVAAYQFRDGLASAFTSGRDAFFADANDGYAGNSVVGQPQAATLAATATSEGFVVSVSEGVYGDAILPLPWSFCVFKKMGEQSFPIRSFAHQNSDVAARMWDGRFAPIALFDEMPSHSDIARLYSWARNTLNVV